MLYCELIGLTGKIGGMHCMFQNGQIAEPYLKCSSRCVKRKITSVQFLSSKQK